MKNHWLLRAGPPCNHLGRTSDWTEQLFCLTSIVFAGKHLHRQDAIEKIPLKQHFLRGEKVSILNGLGPVLGLGLLRARPLERN